MFLTNNACANNDDDTDDNYSKKDKVKHYLVFSSSTFMLPIIYAYKKNNKTLAGLSCLAMIGSMNYWRKPKLGYRRNLDLIMSRLCLLGYFCHVNNNIVGFCPRLLGYTNLFLMCKAYNNSCDQFYLGNKRWYYHHMFFHFCVTGTQLYAIYFT